MALTLNAHEVADMEAYARSLGLEFKFDGLLNPRVDCGASRYQEMQLSPEQMLALDLQNEARMAELREFCRQFVPAPEDVRPAEHVFTCGAGESSFTVDPYGRMQMCQLTRRDSYDLRAGTFAQGWNEYFPRLRARAWQSHSVCRTCTLISLCGSCPGSAEMETGDMESLVPQFCQVAHLRAFAALGDAPGHRPDATCCLGRPGTSVSDLDPHAGAGCGSCGGHQPAPPPLIQIQRGR
jgi:radical SAM protein with 4Fe4S-binding SPASM domain